MADINFQGHENEPSTPVETSAMGQEQESLLEIAELLFFAYRDFTSDPDIILNAIGFGRAHHRVIHFVNRNAGIRVSELLDILRITKQSLGRVLKQLIDTGYIHQRPGAHDRRQRLLYTTEKGRELAQELATPQCRRIQEAIRGAGPESEEAFRTVLDLLINPSEREKVRKIIEK